MNLRVPLKWWEVLEQLHNWRLLKKGSAPWVNNNNVILIYLPTDLTAQRPITKWTWVKKRKIYKKKYKNKAVYIKWIIIIIII
jgi:hypothetical protein